MEKIFCMISLVTLMLLDREFWKLAVQKRVYSNFIKKKVRYVPGWNYQMSGSIMRFCWIRLIQFQANICEPETYASELTEPYNTIVIRDVIEHIDNKKTALKNIFQLLKPNGKVFISFPPKYCAYAGHQQTVPQILGKIPYLHLLPDFIYKVYLKLIGCPGKKIDYLISTKRTRISINQMRKIVTSIGFNVKQESNWFIRPAYSFRFGLPRIKNPFAWFPFLNEIFCNGVLFLLEKPEA